MKFIYAFLFLMFFSILAGAQSNSDPNAIFRKVKNGRFGFYSGNDWLIPPVYDGLSREYSDFMVAKKDKKYASAISLAYMASIFFLST